MAERNQVTRLSQIGTPPGLESKPQCTELCFHALVKKATLLLCSKLTGLSKQLHLETVLTPGITALNLVSDLFARSLSVLAPQGAKGKKVFKNC